VVHFYEDELPDLDAIAGAGFSIIGRAAMPIVTNVNNTTIITASFPEKHGITSNYFIDPRTGQEVYMGPSEFVLARTLSRLVAEKGKESVILTVGEKLENLIRDGAFMAESAEKPHSRLVDKLGFPPEIYTNYLTLTEI
jgi:predicted AlkP superfamily phosphohydrolase/phosphomutase